jgi:hypothetical protein
MTAIDPVACAMFLLSAFVLSGIAQTIWFRSRWSQTFSTPLDGGIRVRGRRLFGDNKTVRGVVVMVPATAAAFATIAALTQANVADRGLWRLSLAQYAVLGAWAACAFMAGELPNSFVKRQLGIAPGASARGFGVICQFACDRLDSGVAMLAAVSLAVPTPSETWLLVLGVGAVLHWLFSVLMFRLGIKARPA